MAKKADSAPTDDGCGLRWVSCRRVHLLVGHSMKPSDYQNTPQTLTMERIDETTRLRTESPGFTPVEKHWEHKRIEKSKLESEANGSSSPDAP